MKIQITSSGTTANLSKYLKMAGKTDTVVSKIKPACEKGVQRLKAATPKDTGETASAWSYEIKVDGGGVTIYWKNSAMNQGKHIAVLLRYGHGTRNGGYVPPNDFITPAMRPIFKEIADEAWKAVTKA